MKTLLMCSVLLLVCPVAMSDVGASEQQFSFFLRDAEMLQFPGVAHAGADPKAAGDIDCNSPAHWDGDTMYMFYSTGHPFRSSGPDFLHLSRPSERTTFDNEAKWKKGGRWIEATHKAKDGKLYMWYHNEPFVLPTQTAPRIGCMVSEDNGLNFKDMGIVLEAPQGSFNLESVNRYFVGGNGDFSVVLDRNEKYLYFFISTYNKDIAEQGVAVARMLYKHRDNPRGNIYKWHKGKWDQLGIGGNVTPFFTADVDWHCKEVDAMWGPSVHFNTYLDAWVMLLNRAVDKEWAQEGIYISFNSELSDPQGWSKPLKVLDAAKLEKSKWYPQVVGTDSSKHQTDKLAGRSARLFVAGISKWEIVFLKPGEKRTE